MREIKFQYMLIREDGSYMVENFPLRDIQRGYAERWMENNPTFVKTKTVIRQFTGLKDKNGVDICEGDIVNWGHIKPYTECKPRIAIVSLDPSLHFMTINLGEHNHAFHYGCFAYANVIDKAMEVIGNIHKNPELIKQFDK